MRALSTRGSAEARRFLAGGTGQAGLPAAAAAAAAACESASALFSFSLASLTLSLLPLAPVPQAPPQAPPQHALRAESTRKGPTELLVVSRTWKPGIDYIEYRGDTPLLHGFGTIAVDQRRIIIMLIKCYTGGPTVRIPALVADLKGFNVVMFIGLPASAPEQGAAAAGHDVRGPQEQHPDR